MSVSREKWECFRNIQPTLDFPLLSINKHEYLLRVLSAPKGKVSENLGLKMFQALTNFQLGHNTLFYMLPCLLHLIIFSLFRYTRQEANAWMGRKFSMSNSIFHSVFLFTRCYVIRGRMSYVLCDFDYTVHEV